MLSWLYYCITGDTSQQKFKCNIGYSASNEKSTELKIHEKVFTIYTQKLGKDTFSKNHNKKYKEVINLIYQPIRWDWHTFQNWNKKT
jgi:hypothetical protein